MTFIKNTSFLSFFLIFTFLSGPSVAMKEEDFNQKSISTHQKNLPIGVPIGSIVAFAGDKEPEGWLMCDGLPYSSKKYPKLYEIIKENYVPSNSWVIEANKISTEKFFHVPDSRGRVLVGIDNGSNRVTSNNTLGATGGEEKHQLTIEEMPEHNHAIGEQFDISSGNHATVCQINKRNHPPYISENIVGNQTHNNMQPYLVSNYIIKAKQDEIVHEEKEVKLFKPLPLKPLKARFGIANYPKSGWQPYTNTSWAPVLFDNFTGDERLKGNLSIIEIPEDGVYSLYVLGRWGANENGQATPYTAIAFNTLDNVDYNFSRNSIMSGCESTHSISRVSRLGKGEKVMVSIMGDQNARYFLGHFGLYIEKLN